MGRRDNPKIFPEATPLEFQVGITSDGKVALVFGKPISTLQLTKDEAEDIAVKIKEFAAKLEG